MLKSKSIRAYEWIFLFKINTIPFIIKMLAYLKFKWFGVDLHL